MRLRVCLEMVFITGTALIGGCGDADKLPRPSSDLNDLQAFVRKAGEGASISGVVVAEREFTFRCWLFSNPYVNDHFGLFGVSVSGRNAYVVADSEAGRAIQRLIGDGGVRHIITVKLGKPRQWIGNDGIVEIVGAREADNK